MREKISSGEVSPPVSPFSEGMTKEVRDKISNTLRLKKEDIFKDPSYVNSDTVKRALLETREYFCDRCLLTKWNGEFITLELEHIDGRRENQKIDNLSFLCPNCHSQTETFRGRNKNSRNSLVTDEDLLRALQQAPSIRQALISVGLSPKGGNYIRCKKLLGK
jgi:hypothetical protein